jgi:type IV secretory pathway VirJ component
MARAMQSRWSPVVCACAALLAGCTDASPPATSRLEAGRLGSVRVIGEPQASDGLVFLFTSQAGWDVEATRAADALVARNLVVVGVDLGAYLAGLAASDDGCHYVVSELEELSKRIQHDRGFDVYRTPVLAGFGAGGTLAYAALAQSPAATVAGAVAVDPTTTLPTKVPLCAGAAATPVPGAGFRYAAFAKLPGWYAIAPSGAGDTASRLVAVLDAHLAAAAGTGASRVHDLPLVEYPVAVPSPLLAIIYSGDGGWRDLDKQIGEALAAAGVPVVGVDSLRYFWHRKPPDTLATDLAAIVREYQARWKTSKLMLVGYSFGADVLPFAVNRLPDDVRAGLSQVSLLGLDATAAFEFSVAGWFGADVAETPVLPELLRLDPRLVQCFYGEEEDESLCRDPALHDMEIVRTEGGHHFGGDYDVLAARILDGARRRAGLATSSPGPSARARPANPRWRG